MERNGARTQINEHTRTDNCSRSRNQSANQIVKNEKENPQMN